MLHALLLAGGSGESRRALAERLAADLLGAHREDLIPVERQSGKAGIGVEEVEALVGRLSYKPYGDRYVVIVGEAHLMTPAAQNKLLKTLEEPVSPAVIMLLAETRDAMLATVRSRCSIYQLSEPALEADDGVRQTARALMELSRREAPFYLKKNALSEILSDKDTQRTRSLALVNLLEEEILKAAGDGDLSLMKDVPALREARKALRQVHNTAYTMKRLCLHI